MTDAMTALILEMKKEIREEIKRELMDEIESQRSATKIWMNKKETAAYLGVSVNTFNKYLNQYPRFPFSNIAGAKRYNVRNVDEFIEITGMMNK
ncbi:MAG: helix-turn-helix domain-containing protein [Alkalibacterium sp.]|nr:helix-turn-helix domain-containing protein [Alkalibacterium sp.]